MAENDFREFQRRFRTGELSLPDYLGAVKRYFPRHPLTSLLSAPGDDVPSFDSLTQTEQQVGYGVYVLFSQSANISEAYASVLLDKGERSLDVHWLGHYKERSEIECQVLLSDDHLVFCEFWPEGTRYHGENSLDELALPFEKRLDLECTLPENPQPDRCDLGDHVRESSTRLYTMNNSQDAYRILIEISKHGVRESVSSQRNV